MTHLADAFNHQLPTMAGIMQTLEWISVVKRHTRQDHLIHHISAQTVVRSGEVSGGI